MGELTEKLYPLVLGALAALGYFLLLRHEPIPDTGKDLLGAVINLAAIAIGFLATIKSLLISIENRPDVTWLKSGQFYSRFHRYVFHAIHGSFIVAIVSSIYLLLFGRLQASPWASWAVTCYVALVVFTAAAYFRVVTVFGLMLQAR